MRLVDARTGAPVASEVELWRMDPGSNDTWSAQVPADGFSFRDLPAGRYRAHPTARRRDTDDPAAFEVVAPRTEVELAIETPALHRVALAVYDENGRPVRRGVLVSGYHHRPALGAPFAPLDDGSAAGSPPPEGAQRTRFGGRRVSVEERGRLILGQVRDRDCDQGGGPWYEFRATDRSAVVVDLPGHELHSPDRFVEAASELLLVGVALPGDWFDAAIRLPDGSRARDRGASLTVLCPAVPAGDGEARTWRDVPVAVTAELAGYDELSFTYTLAEGPPRPRVLSPSSE